MKIIYNNYIPFKGFRALNFFGILFVRKKYNTIINISDSLLTHESIHSEQYKELLYLFFLPLYIIEWFIKLIISLFIKSEINNFAYRSISFEQEAYYHQYNKNYLKERKHYNWIKYIFKMYNQDIAEQNRK